MVSLVVAVVGLVLALRTDRTGQGTRGADANGADRGSVRSAITWATTARSMVTTAREPRCGAVGAHR